MGIHLLYFHLPCSERLEVIHGAAIAREACGDLTRRFKALARDLLRQHQALAVPSLPEYGLWAFPFVTRRLEIAADEREQLDAIAAAGAELGREAVSSELGSAVALHSGLSVGVLGVEGSEGEAAWLRSLRAHLRRAAPSRPGPAAAERERVRAVVGGGFELLLQDIVALDTRRPRCYEALLRGPAGPLREPERLLPEAARCGLREELELASLDAALAVARRLPAPLRLAVNLSPDFITAPAVKRMADEPGLPERLVLEITEHLPVPAPGRLRRLLAPLRRRGAQLSLDDAGCGYLNMELVRALAPDIVKLCITVTRRIGRGPGALAEVGRAVAGIRAAGAEALAEGVETEEQARLARLCGCALAQGWLFGRPRPAEAVLAEAARSAEHDKKVTARA